jgi:hypothetical protein
MLKFCKLLQSAAIGYPGPAATLVAVGVPPESETPVAPATFEKKRPPIEAGAGGGSV